MRLSAGPSETIRATRGHTDIRRMPASTVAFLVIQCMLVCSHARKRMTSRRRKSERKKPRTNYKLIDLLKCVVLSSVSLSEQTKYRSHPKSIKRLLAARVHDVLSQIDTNYSHLSVYADFRRYNYFFNHILTRNYLLYSKLCLKQIQYVRTKKFTN